jgi:ABC-type uncharacterized transport system ATPase subunit
VIRSLQVAFGGAKVLRGVNLSLQRGELASLIGPNGCGKTTLLNALTGQIPVDSGEARLGDASLLGLRPDRIARLGVARKFQVPSVFPMLSVAENLTVARLAAGQDTSRDRAVLEETGLADAGARIAGTLAHGQKQWLEIGMLLVQRPQLLLLDEPTAGMTAAETRATVRLLHRLRDSFAVTMLVVEHDMRFIEALQSRVMVMITGEIVADGCFGEARRNERVRLAYLGRVADG